DRFPEIRLAEVALCYADVLGSAVGHEVGEKADRIGKRARRGLEPDDSPGERRELLGFARRGHGRILRGRRGRRAGSLFTSTSLTAAARSPRIFAGRSRSAGSSW